MSYIFLDSSEKINKNCIPLNLNNIILKAMIRGVLPNTKSEFFFQKIQVMNIY